MTLGDVTRTPRPVSSVTLWVALVTVSWDRFANIDLGAFNLKLPIVLFALALVLTAVDALRTPTLPGKKQKVLPWAFVVLVTFAVVGLAARNVVAAETQAATVLLGAIIPFAVTYWNLRIFGNIDAALTWFIRGGWVASIFGLYQLGAFYTGLPQIVEYGAIGGGFGRISSFSYEAAYFGYFLILVLGALFARAHLRRQSVNRWHVVFFVLVLLLANTRAAWFTLPLFFVILAFRRPTNTFRARMLPIVIAGVWAVIVGLLLRPEIVPALTTRALSIFDTADQTSNQPRLQGYASALRVIHDHLVLGVGPGNYIDYAQQYGLDSTGQTANTFIANNIWLQAALDGGLVLLVVQVVFILVAIVTLLKKRYPAARALMAGWLATLLVASMLTSFFFTADLWVTLAIAAACSALNAENGPLRPQRDAAAGEGRSARSGQNAHV